MSRVFRHRTTCAHVLLWACASVACAPDDPAAARAPSTLTPTGDGDGGLAWGHMPPTDDAGSTDTGAPPAPGAESVDGALVTTDAHADVCHGRGSRFATRVVSHGFGPGQSDGQGNLPLALGPPKGGGADQGSTDTVSLGNGGWIVLGFDEIVDGPGPDLIVFENPFRIQGDPSSVFAELGTVAVSEDGVSWVSFPCVASRSPYGECSGWRVVYANADTNTIDPTDPAVAGGDPYDLAEVGLAHARYVRITDRPDLGGMNGVYDLDAVSLVHPRCP